MLWLIPALPLLGSLVCGILHFMELRARRQDSSGPAQLAGWVACAAILGALILAVQCFMSLRGMDPGERVLESSAWSWIDAGSLMISVSMVVDPLSSLMTLIITGVGLLIHIYSVGYMQGDAGYAKFFAYLNLFVTAMLMLVLSSSLLGLFVGWEGVGLCSYLLIGFWYDKGWPAEAGQKAFVVNRIGDACFLIGSFMLVRLFGTLDLSDLGRSAAMIFSQPDQLGELTAACLLLFGGACGKSAQWPLFVWLPDAMAGPTPVSALIHAATMVTAGVYLVVRLNPLFAAADSVLLVIGLVGALTAVIGASSALLQRDIKKVLAYSTVSQLGYMFLALGVGAWSSAVFHLMTHAFFKGLLFLGAGSVIHGMHDEQDMYKMGGLRKHMPRTFVTFLCGSMALSGLPLMSGFFSKDEILAMNFASGGIHIALWIVGLCAAAMTAFYTWRMVALTFFGEERFDKEHVHPHESPASMTVPLIILAILAVGGGVFGLPHVFHVNHLLSDWLKPITDPGNELLFGGEHHALAATTEWLLLGLGSVIALVFAHYGFHSYRQGTQADQGLRRLIGGAASFFENAWNIDRDYTRHIVQPVKLLGFTIASLVDQLAIDGVANGAATLARKTAGKLRGLTDGNVKSYALWMGAGAAILTLFWIA